MKYALIALVVAVVVAPIANAEYKLYVKLNTDAATHQWSLYGWTSGTCFGIANDGSANAGLAGYNIWLSGIATGVKAAPYGYKPTEPDKGTWGFNVGPEEMFVESNGDTAAFGGQDTRDLNRCIYDVGNTPGSLEWVGAWDRPLLLATGTYNVGQTPAVRDVVNGVATTSIAAVFAAPGVIPAWEATIYVVPEPASLGLLALGAMAMLRRRR